MHNQSGPLAAEQQFFSSLIGGDVGALDRILGDDFLLIDVMTGSEVKKPDLLAVLGSRSAQIRGHSACGISGSPLWDYGRDYWPHSNERTIR